MTIRSQDKSSGTVNSRIQPFLECIALELAERWADQHRAKMQPECEDSSDNIEEFDT